MTFYFQKTSNESLLIGSQTPYYFQIITWVRDFVWSKMDCTKKSIETELETGIKTCVWSQYFCAKSVNKIVQVSIPGCCCFNSSGMLQLVAMMWSLLAEYGVVLFVVVVVVVHYSQFLLLLLQVLLGDGLPFVPMSWGEMMLVWSLFYFRSLVCLLIALNRLGSSLLGRWHP